MGGYEVKKHKKFSFGLTRDYGAITVHFDATFEGDVSTWEEELRETEKLIQQVWAKHDYYAKNHLHKTQDAPPRPDSDFKTPGAFEEAIPCEVAERTIDGGKEYIKIKGGKYVKHGVVIWKEVLETTDIMQRMGSAHSLDMRGYIMIVDTKGKPKVVKVTKANGT